MATDRSTILTAYAALEELAAKVAGFDYTGLSVPELLQVQSRREVLARSAPVVDHALLAALQVQTTAKEIGAKNWAEVLAIRLRISGEEARRRVRDAENLGPRVTLTGEALPPVWEKVAHAQADGTINIEHVKVIGHFFTVLPSWVDEATRAQCEATLIAGARHQTPDELRQAADRLRYLLDQDGPAPDDAERARKRGITIGKQQADGTCDISGRLSPEGRAIWEAVQAKLAAPGMANPTDPTPCLSGTPSAEQITSDTRTAAQRHHDALTAAMRMVLASGTLGEHNGIPVSVVVTTTLHELHTGAGLALTHTGSTLPIPDLIKMASNAYCYLAVFDHHTNIPLYLGRTRRTASPGQRIMLFARDRGCTRP
ncbi:MAG: 13E12 repeat family protein, partial [Mycobacterium sp.]